MKQQLEQRLKELKTEFEAGQKMLAELGAKRANMQESMLRISGAIQVLEEELATEAKPEKRSNEKEKAVSKEANSPLPLHFSSHGFTRMSTDSCKSKRLLFYVKQNPCTSVAKFFYLA